MLGEVRYPGLDHGLGQVEEAGLRQAVVQSPPQDLRAYVLEARMGVCLARHCGALPWTV